MYRCKIVFIESSIADNLKGIGEYQIAFNVATKKRTFSYSPQTFSQFEACQIMGIEKRPLSNFNAPVSNNHRCNIGIKKSLFAYTGHGIGDDDIASKIVKTIE